MASLPGAPAKELPQYVAEEVRQRIVNQGMQPGDQCPSEAELMEIFGVSRSTVREAVKILVAENVVEIRRGKGTFIASSPGRLDDPLGLHFSDKENLVYSLLETRLIVEPQIARLAALRASEKDIDALQSILDKFEELTLEQDERFAALDIEFHITLARASQNDVLYRFMPGISDSIQWGKAKTKRNKASHQRAMKSHRLILQAVQQKQPEEALQAARIHVMQTAKDILGQGKQWEQFEKDSQIALKNITVNCI